MIDRYWLALAQEFHLMPWDLDRLTYVQLQGACRAVDEMRRQAEKG